MFPARSWQEPRTAASARSGPEYVCGGTQESIPEVASTPLKSTEIAWLYQPFESGRALRRRADHGRGRVVAQPESVSGRVPGVIHAGAADRRLRVVRAGVGLRRDARGDPGRGIRPAEGHRERVVVPALRVRGAAGACGHRRPGRVVAEPEGPRGRVPGAVYAGTVHRGGRVVGAGVALSRDAGIEPRHRVRPAEGDRQHMVVPTVRVGSAGRSRGDDRPGSVVPERKRPRAGVPRVILAGARHRGVRRVRAGVGLRGDAGLDSGDGVRAGEADRERMVVPAVRIRVAGGSGGDGRVRPVVLEVERERGARVPGPVPAGAVHRRGRVVRARVRGLRARVDSRSRVRSRERDREACGCTSRRDREAARESRGSPAGRCRRS